MEKLLLSWDKAMLINGTDELEVVSWNWCAPMHLGLNCICVNGKTCCAFASVWMPHETTTKIRDVFEETMQEYIDAGKKEMV